MSQVIQTETKGQKGRIKKPLRRILRWLVWALLLLIFIRGAATLLIPAKVADTAAVPVVATEPEGFRVFPLLFVYEYLQWQPDNLTDYVQKIKPYLASSLDSQAGWIATEQNRTQSVLNAWVYGFESTGDLSWLVTVAARVQVHPSGASAAPKTAASVSGAEVRTLYLAVPVVYKNGGWVVSDYPALLPAPPTGSVSDNAPSGQIVTDEGQRVEKLLTGFFSVYTNVGQGEVTYYLLPGSSSPGILSGFAFHALDGLKLYRDDSGTYAAAKVILEDKLTGSRLTLRYSFKLVEQEGRWYIKEIMEQGV